MPSVLQNRKYLHELSTLIDKKDIRSVRKWCWKSNLHIYKDSSGEFVNAGEFSVVYNLPIITRLKTKYGDSWQTYYDFYQSGKIEEILLQNSSPPISKVRYNPQGKLSAKIFEESRK